MIYILAVCCVLVIVVELRRRHTDLAQSNHPPTTVHPTAHSGIGLAADPDMDPELLAQREAELAADDALAATMGAQGRIRSVCHWCDAELFVDATIAAPHTCRRCGPSGAGTIS